MLIIAIVALNKSPVDRVSELISPLATAVSHQPSEGGDISLVFTHNPIESGASDISLSAPDTHEGRVEDGGIQSPHRGESLSSDGT